MDLKSRKNYIGFVEVGGVGNVAFGVAGGRQKGRSGMELKNHSLLTGLPTKVMERYLKIALRKSDICLIKWTGNRYFRFFRTD